MSSTTQGSTTSSGDASRGSESTGAPDTSSTGDTDGCSFLDELCICEIADECDPFAQDCCEGLKCNAWAKDGGGGWNANGCFPVDMDPDQIHELCTVVESGVSGMDSCELGAMCWDVDFETKTGVCIELCKGDEMKCWADPASCCPQGGSCRMSGPLNLCMQYCDPIAQDCWSRDKVCYAISDTFLCVPDESGAMGQPGDPCEIASECDPGAFCGYPTAFPGCDLIANGCCIPHCKLDAPVCPPGTECTPWFDVNPPPEYANLGACVIPG